MKTLRVINTYKLKTELGLILIVTVGADDPNDLENQGTRVLADKTAKKQGVKRFIRASKVFIKGQSVLPTRKYYYKIR